MRKLFPFLGSINGSPTLPVDFTGPIDQMTCDQSYCRYLQHHAHRTTPLLQV